MHKTIEALIENEFRRGYYWLRFADGWKPCKLDFADDGKVNGGRLKWIVFGGGRLNVDGPAILEVVYLGTGPEVAVAP